MTLETGRDEAVLEVANGNRGPPIAPEALARLFEPFQQANNERRSGLGLGLFISRSIAEAHHGTLIAQSDADGTRFTLHLPRR